MDVRNETTFLQERWGDALMARGFVAVPVAFLQLQERLGLEALDLVIVLHLMRFWVLGLPFPAQETLARACQVHVRTLRRRLRALRAAGYLETHKDTSPSGKAVIRYDVRPLIKSAEAMAVARGIDKPADKKVWATTQARRGKISW